MKGDTAVIVGLVVATVVVERRARRRRQAELVRDAECWQAYLLGWYDGRAFASGRSGA